MTSFDLGRSYFLKATKRLKVLDVLIREEAYSDVIREAQEIVELALKGALRLLGVEPPKIHDVGPLLVENRDRFPEPVARNTPELARISKWLRREREFSFYGDIDLLAFTCLKALNICMEHGNAEESPHAYILFAAWKTMSPNIENKVLRRSVHPNYDREILDEDITKIYEEAYSFGQLAIELIERLKRPDLSGSVNQIYGTFVHHGSTI